MLGILLRLKLTFTTINHRDILDDLMKTFFDAHFHFMLKDDSEVLYIYKLLMTTTTSWFATAESCSDLLRRVTTLMIYNNPPFPLDQVLKIHIVSLDPRKSNEEWNFIV